MSLFGIINAFLNFDLDDTEYVVMFFMTAHVCIAYSMFLNPNLPIYDSMYILGT